MATRKNDMVEYKIWMFLQNLNRLKRGIWRNNTSPQLSSLAIKVVKGQVNDITEDLWRNYVRHVIDIKSSLTGFNEIIIHVTNDDTRIGKWHYTTLIFYKFVGVFIIKLNANNKISSRVSTARELKDDGSLCDDNLETATIFASFE